MGLETYKRKRNFKRTPEPSGKVTPRSGWSFTIQRHHATRLHYDFRLELDGVLVSWAVPKGPSLNPRDRRLAVQVEDHPVDYGEFEGTIPKGQYGGGVVVLWDRGTWRPIGDPREGLRKGHLKFTLDGHKLKGAWALVRMSEPQGAKPTWLLIKDKDEHASAQDVTKTRPESVSRRAPRVWQSNREERRRPSSKRPLPALPEFEPPQLASLSETAPTGEGWLHELKFDGYRLVCRLDEGEVRLLTRRGNDWTASFKDAALALAGLEARQAVLDGEIVALDEKGAPSFQALQNSKGPFYYYAFDLLWLDGRDLRGLPLRERKEALRKLLAGTSDPVRYSDHVEGEGEEFFAQACRMGLEGIVSKRADAPYHPGRGKSWLKVKCLKRQELVVLGWTEPGGSRKRFGALLLGVREEGKLRFVGKVGTGFDGETLKRVYDKLVPLEVPEAPVTPAPREKGAHWVRPELAAEIAFSEWTTDGKVRQPVFYGLRLDKPASEVVRERPAPKITNPGRVLYPEQGVTKADLAAYYEAVADQALAHIKGRPLALVRCPEGHQKGCFFQKHPGRGTPSVVRSIPIVEGGETRRTLYIESFEGLMGLVQLGALEIHPWGCRIEDVEHPDRLVFDMDPAPGLGWDKVVLAARTVRARLEELGLKSWVKTTGGKGLHVVVPLAPSLDWDTTKAFTKTLTESMARREPHLYTPKLPKAERKGRIFIDYLRNGRGATAVAAYSTRARAGAPVALPVFWEELEDLEPGQFTVKNVPKRLAKLKKDPWDGFFEIRQSLTPAIISAVS